MTAPSKRSRSCVRTLAIIAPVLMTAGTIWMSPAGGDPRQSGRPANVDVPIPHPILTQNVLLEEAQPDECFVDIGIDYPPINPDGTCDEGTPKTNESYIWGLTEESGKLYFGTMANTACIVDRAPDGGTGSPSGIEATPEGMVCEYGQSEIAREHPTIPDSLGDWRPPSLYQYDLASGQLVHYELGDPLQKQTLGFRGAGSIDNIAFVAGQNLFNNSINFFAFQADTGAYLGSCELTGYNYVREWELAGGVLYVGAGTNTRGAVLRWDGDVSSFGGDFCADFTNVANLTADAANVALYHGGDGQDRLAVTTVPIGTSPNGVGVWISPPLGADGLTAADADGWHQVWTPKSYDPDTIVARYGYSMGAEVSFDGWLYWGTIHLSDTPANHIHERCHAPFCFGPPQTPEEEQELAQGVHRTTSIWRGRNLESPDREIQLLYGETQLPACCDVDGHFVSTPTGWTPLYGPSGFGNRNNEYTWQMAVFDGHLFIGTYDASTLKQTPEGGGDLWRFDSSNSAAVNENYRGLGDTYNYGIRALAALDDGSALIVGMANPFNLRVGGGWELRSLSEPPSP